MSQAPQRVPPTSLKSRVFRAGGWTLVGFFLRHGIRFGSNLIMTRLLVPEMFGVMAIASLVLAGLSMFSDLGLRQSVVQSKRGEEASFLNTVWIVQILRGFLLWFFACLISLILFAANGQGLFPPGSVYTSADLPLVIAVVSVGVLISGFESTKVFESSRRLALSRLTGLEVAAQLAAFLCMLAWVSIDRTIWALVAGSITSYLLRAILTHTHLQGTGNRWQWDRSAFTEIFSYGKWVFASSILGFLVKSGDRIMLGALVNASILGVYVIAYVIYEVIEQLFNRVLVDVSFPALSQIARERSKDLINTYYKFHFLIASFAYFVAGFLIMTGPGLIDILYDDRYREAGWMLSILSVAILNFPSRLADQSFLALGMPRLLSNITTFRLITLYSLVPAGYYTYGLQGAIWGIALSQLFRWPLVIYYAIRLNLFDFRKELVVLPFIPLGAVAGHFFNIALKMFA